MNVHLSSRIIDGTFTDVAIDNVTNRAPTWWNDPYHTMAIDIFFLIFILYLLISDYHWSPSGLSFETEEVGSFRSGRKNTELFWGGGDPTG